MPYITRHHLDGAVERIGFGQHAGERKIIKWPDQTRHDATLDLADEANWEDEIEFESLEDNGFEEGEEMPQFGGPGRDSNGVHAYLAWFYDGDYDESLA